MSKKPYEILAENIPITPDDDEYAFERYTTMDIIRLDQSVLDELSEATWNDEALQTLATFSTDAECDAAEEKFEREWLRNYLGLVDKDAWMPGDTSVHYWLGLEDFFYGARVLRVYRKIARNV